MTIDYEALRHSIHQLSRLPWTRMRNKTTLEVRIDEWSAIVTGPEMRTYRIADTSEREKRPTWIVEEVDKDRLTSTDPQAAQDDFLARVKAQIEFEQLARSTPPFAPETDIAIIYGTEPPTCADCRVKAGEQHKRDCFARERHYWQTVAPPLDLRPITRCADRCRTRIELQLGADYRRTYEWIVAGQCGRLHPMRTHVADGEFELRIYLKDDATDVEHDSAFALMLPLTNVQWTGRVDYHGMRFTAVLGHRIDDYRVPPPGYDPLSGAEMCDYEQCEHPVVAYLPPANFMLGRRLAGRRVIITLSSPEDA